MGRIEWVDAAKGLGMVAVVFAHVHHGDLSQVLYWFHMPLFFMVSGYLFRSNESTGAYAKKRAKQLLVPYLAWVLIFSALAAAKNPQHLPEIVRNAILGGSWLTGSMGVFWFVTCLYLALVGYHALRNLPGLSWLCLAMYGLALLRARLLPAAHFPWAVDAVLIAIPCIHLGALAKVRGWTEGRLPWALGATLVVAAGLFFAGYFVSPFDVKNARYGLPVFGALLAIAGTAGAVSLAKVAGPLTRPLAYIGEASFFVMFTHQALNLALTGKSDLLRFAVTLGVPLALYPVARSFAPLRVLLLGDRGKSGSVPSLAVAA